MTNVLIFVNREQRSSNTLYQELSFQDAEALGEMDDGVDITGTCADINITTFAGSCPITVIVLINISVV